MKYYDILKLMEAKQVGILYHYTSIENAINICVQNELRPGESDGVSFTRNKHFHDTEREGISTGVKFVIDGDKLSEKYKIKPFNYFKNSNQSHGIENTYYHYDYYDEQEELVKSPIKNLSKYVIKVYIDRHHADCYFDDIDSGDIEPKEDIISYNELLKYFNRYFPSEWAK